MREEEERKAAELMKRQLQERQEKERSRHEEMRKQGWVPDLGQISSN